MSRFRVAPGTVVPAVVAILAAGLWPHRAQAHSFRGGAEYYEQFLQGCAVILAYPATLLPLIALGILLSLWRADGMLRAWPVFAGGQVAGIGVAALVGPWILPVMLGLGAGVATLAALLPRQTRPVVLAAAGLTGAISVAISLEGHGFLELSVFIHAGVLYALNMVTVAVAALARLALDRVEAMWMRILWRIAASWIAAILILYLAFTLSQGGA